MTLFSEDKKLADQTASVATNGANGSLIIILLVAFLLAVGLIAFSTRNHGAGTSPDSVEYIAIARNLLAGAGFTSMDGMPIVKWSPLYPLLLAGAARIAGKDPLAVAGPLNAILFGMIVCVCGMLLTHLRALPTPLKSAGILTTLISIPLVRVSQMAWSETLFTLCSLCALYFAILYWRQQDIRRVILMSCSISVAGLTRYGGLVLAIWGGALIILSLWGERRRMLAHLSSHSMISTLPIAIWLVRNRVLFGSYAGVRGSAALSIADNIADAVRTVLSWYIPGALTLPWWAIGGLLIASLAAVTILFRSTSARSVWMSARRQAPLLLFISMYSALVVLYASIAAVDRLDDRLLSPLFVPLTLIFLLLLARLIDDYRIYFSARLASILPAVGLAIWLLYPLRTVSGDVKHQAIRGLGYSNVGWEERATLHYLQTQPALESGCTLYSNDPFAIYILAGSIAQTSPAQTFYNSAQVKDSEETIQQSWPPETPACLVWFEGVGRDDLYSLEQLQALIELQPIEVYRDGAIYQIPGG